MAGIALEEQAAIGRPRPHPIDQTADAEAVLAHLVAARATGRGAVLVAITGLTASSVRGLGALMAVLPDGGYAGSFSGGCIEAAIVGEALDALDAGQPRQVRFGAGSPYIDVRLPCGGGVDLTFLPNPDAALIDGVLTDLRARRPAQLALGAAEFHYVPRLRVIVVGQGAETVALTDLTRAFGGAVDVVTPQPAIVEEAAAAGARARLIRTPGEIGTLSADPWTAIALLFHDHDWELAVLRAALASPAFWIGAMGGAKTRAARIAMLAAAGVAPADIARVRSPIGLIPSARDPSTLALSALAEIVAAYRAAGTA
ncbi:XdhC family protein [Sphingomonas quercus]|uniref:XdhC family protein n=1 Tax=Sphingomonas quercus TaxID=2842451 RepID=A0ABS6BPP9_9SPHN|nr:XdhC family protein [Sphingomonas quercus]MBU3079239.1 XdhC family protein [Sphingomonas quercus]